MARIRTIKPELASDVKLATVSIQARYTFLLLITQADDEGLIAGAHRQLLGALYPHDDAVTPAQLLGWIEELVAIGVLRWRATTDGAPVVSICNWSKHQRVDNKSRSQLAVMLAPPADIRGDSPQPAAEIRLDLGPRTKDLGPGSPPQKSAAEPQRRTAASVLAKIKSLAEVVEVPGQGRKMFIRKARVEELGPKTYAAYERIGGADAVLNTPGEKWSFLVRDFERELRSA